MGLESATYIAELNASNPSHAVDPIGEGDDHIRLIKAAILATFPNFAGVAVTKTEAQLNAVDNLPEVKVQSSALEKNADDTLENIPGVTGLTLEAAKTYWMEGTFHIDTNLTALWQFALQLSQTPQEFHFLIEAVTASDEQNETLTHNSGLAIAGGATDSVLKISAHILAHASSAGTLALQGAQAVSTAYATRCEYGFLQLWKLD